MSNSILLQLRRMARRYCGFCGISGNSNNTQLLRGPFVGLLIGILAAACGMEDKMAKMIGITTWMVIYWLEGTVRMGLTGLFPIVLLPMFGISQGIVLFKLHS